MDQENQKLLVVTDNKLPHHLAEYALNVAIRLDLEVIVLFIDEQHSQLKDDLLTKRIADFGAEMEKTAAEFTTLAWRSSVKVTTIVDVDEREKAIRRTREEDPNIRFIVSDGPVGQNEGNGSKHYPRLEVVRSEE